MLERWFLLWLIKIAAALAVLFAIVYLGDWAVYRLRGSPQSKVTVNQFVSIPQKARKTEFDYLGTLDQPCAVAIFDQGNEMACWRLRKNPNLGVDAP
jgi:sterol desaturase/sphingolipid hydroxylase (fatty acid hydroxylase superfamily)